MRRPGTRLPSSAGAAAAGHPYRGGWPDDPLPTHATVVTRRGQRVPKRPAGPCAAARPRGRPCSSRGGRVGPAHPLRGCTATGRPSRAGHRTPGVRRRPDARGARATGQPACAGHRTPGARATGRPGCASPDARGTQATGCPGRAGGGWRRPTGDGRAGPLLGGRPTAAIQAGAGRCERPAPVAGSAGQGVCTGASTIPSTCRMHAVPHGGRRTAGQGRRGGRWRDIGGT
jgi:hypothetical protein